ncbi:lysozyme inhibitor LprI family protein [Sphingomonas sp. GCM10030256]|uniref:lysozyme inhibitor LprI family protein n=1 Tax=Sphingomonas sp. GCM10030256 TaxID=3273427 RepID=UPI0036132CF7
MPDRSNEPPYDPRLDPRHPDYDPRFEQRHSRFEPRDPRFDPRYDQPHEQDPRERAYDPRLDPRENAAAGRYPDPRDQHDPRYGGGDRTYDPRFDPHDQSSQRGAAPPPPPPSGTAATAPRRSRTRTLALAAGLLGLLLVALFAFRMTRSGPGEDRLDGNAAASAGTPAKTAEERCGSQRSYDLVKQALFRQAAQLRGSDQSAFDRLSSYATVRVTSPVLKRQDEELGTLVCSGDVALDLPPGVGVVGGRRTLQASLDYSLQPAADGSGDVMTLSGADSIVVPLATLARTGSPRSAPPASGPAPVPPSSSNPGTLTPSAPGPVPAPAPLPPPSPAPAVRRQADSEPQAAARPSFNCRSARTRGEVAVCNDVGLASLDRQMASQFVRAIGSADSGQRSLLQQTRTRFLRYRDSCSSDSCIAAAYRGRMREIDDIMADRWVAPR